MDIDLNIEAFVYFRFVSCQLAKLTGVWNTRLVQRAACPAIVVIHTCKNTYTYYGIFAVYYIASPSVWKSFPIGSLAKKPTPKVYLNLNDKPLLYSGSVLV